uniref:Uncharacterized protein n=1 Tax=Octopus bimaculoides TaxID=37653 RepID=A0A0L8GRA9_OCTBM
MKQVPVKHWGPRNRLAYSSKISELVPIIEGILAVVVIGCSCRRRRCFSRRSDAKSVVQQKDTYPTSLSMSDISEATNYIPELLRLLLNTVFVRKEKNSCSYSEVQKYERVADNVDHDTRTLDGSESFHGMSIIAVVTPKCDGTSVVKRVSVTAECVLQQDTSALRNSYRLVMNLLISSMKLYQRNPNTGKDPRDHPGQSSTMFLPMVDMNPRDMTCVNSTLHFVAEYGKLYGATPVLPFDRPLWFKTTIIAESAGEESHLHPMVLRLRGFHIPMSFLGSIEHLMRETGSQEFLEMIFAGNTVTHIFTGNAVARAIRGHLLVDSVLHTLLLSCLLGIKLSLSNDSVPLELETIGNLYDDLLSGEITLNDVESSLYLQDLQQKLETHKDILESKYCTAHLWLQYTEMIDIMRSFMRSERIGD